MSAFIISVLVIFLIGYVVSAFSDSNEVEYESVTLPTNIPGPRESITTNRLRERIYAYHDQWMGKKHLNNSETNDAWEVRDNMSLEQKLEYLENLERHNHHPEFVWMLYWRVKEARGEV